MHLQTPLFSFLKKKDIFATPYDSFKFNPFYMCVISLYKRKYIQSYLRVYLYTRIHGAVMYFLYEGGKSGGERGLVS